MGVWGWLTTAESQNFRFSWADLDPLLGGPASSEGAKLAAVRHKALMTIPVRKRTESYSCKADARELSAG